MRRLSQRGFTIPEVMVALLVFAAISAGGVFTLRLSLDARDQFEAADLQLTRLEMARAIIREDFSQVALRRVREEFGADRGPAFEGGDRIVQGFGDDDEEVLLAFVRRGWKNPESRSPRSSLQFVEYVLSGDKLIRRTRPFLDDARDLETHERVLFEGLQSASFGFLAGEAAGRNNWSPNWPVAGDTDSAPKAIELITQSDRYGSLRQLFWLGELGAASDGGGDA